MIKFYVSKVSDTYSKQILNTELHSDYVCLNPNYNKLTIKRPVKILMDSGAFQDRIKRRSFEEALERQLKFEKKLGLISDKIVAYDLIDDVEQTVAANIFLSQHRESLKPRTLVLMLQGKSREDYIRCFELMRPLLHEEDCIGFGGFAKSSNDWSNYTKLLHALADLLPEIRKTSVKKLHFFGIAKPKTLKLISDATKDFEVSFDSSALELGAVRGKAFISATNSYEPLEGSIPDVLKVSIKGMNQYLQELS